MKDILHKMLNQIDVKNYRNLKQLNIGRLGRVNLIIGKNNTGKTSFLESLDILLSSGLDNIINNILTSRQEKLKDFKSISDQIDEINSFFYGRDSGFHGKDQIEIIGYASELESPLQFSMRFVKYIEQKISLSDPSVPESVTNILAKAYKVKLEVPISDSNGSIGLHISRNNETYIRSFDDSDVLDNMVSSLLGERQTISCHFLSAINPIDDQNLNIWWSKTALTDGEDTAIDALKIIEPRIERLSQIKEKQEDDTRFVVKLSGHKRPVPLRSMGDGINRILTLSLALINSENGYLLIDEFENGLHYSVQEKLWEIIFHLAEKLNIQVFATTHSNDTIAAFENIVNKNETNPLDGLLIKLENADDNIEAMIFEPSELKVITDNLIEVRR